MWSHFPKIISTYIAKYAIFTKYSQNVNDFFQMVKLREKLIFVMDFSILFDFFYNGMYNFNKHHRAIML